MFVGEGPGFEEDRRGEPFVGKAGQLLDRILASIGLSRRTVYIANIVKCHPMRDPSRPESRGNDRPPAPDEIEACRGYLDEQIRALRPRALVIIETEIWPNMLRIAGRRGLPVALVNGRVSTRATGAAKSTPRNSTAAMRIRDTLANSA